MRMIGKCVSNIRSLCVVALFGASGASFAANSGLIVSLDYSGVQFGSHPDVVQLQIAGGFGGADFPSCNTTFAAIRKVDTHLVAAVTAAHLAGKPVSVYLNPNDSYFPSQNRCVITNVRLAN